MKDFPKPLLEGMSRKEITETLSRELVKHVLEVQGRYSYWAAEVWLDRYTERQKRVDFISFEPFGGPTYTDAPRVERGLFSFFEVKSCVADLRSGHGLTFEGDLNYIVMPVEMWDAYKGAIHGDENLYSKTSLARCVLYGGNAAGKPGFYFTGEKPVYSKPARRRPASELLFCMMRASIANSAQGPRVDAPRLAGVMGSAPEQATVATLGSVDEYEAKMDALLCRLTNGKFSKSREYDLDFMVSCVEEEFESPYAE